MQQMLRAKCLWGLHIGMLKPTLSIRAFGDPLVRARKAGRLMNKQQAATNCRASICFLTQASSNKRQAATIM